MLLYNFLETINATGQKNESNAGKTNQSFIEQALSDGTSQARSVIRRDDTVSSTHPCLDMSFGVPPHPQEDSYNCLPFYGNADPAQDVSERNKE